MNVSEEIKEIYRQYWRYMIDKDEKRLRSLMSEDYYLLHMTGTRQTADEFISGLIKGTFNYYSVQHDSIDVTINGDRAALTGKSRVVAAVYGGGKSSWRLQGDFTLRKEHGSWKLTSSRASAY
ncbi:MAG: nuclear transport factor 2 family protein [Erysipelotrichaceae bacterium]|nr:nuclear transport factor 2 family protein [Erysipelotrichaceae bacterium]